VLVGIPLGVVAALRHNAWPDYLLRIVSVLGIAMAACGVAMMVRLVGSLQLGWLPWRGDLASTVTTRCRRS
jgi:ABC-type dipeptide/oligopeptide/nickel transport system permease component